jgi:hypothetical protein
MTAERNPEGVPKGNHNPERVVSILHLPFILSKPLRLRVAPRVACGSKIPFCQTNPFPPILQSLSKRFKAFQSYSKVLEKIFFPIPSSAV